MHSNKQTNKQKNLSCDFERDHEFDLERDNRQLKITSTVQSHPYSSLNQESTQQVLVGIQKLRQH